MGGGGGEKERREEMAEKMSRNDLCSGYVEGTKAPMGRCRCGLVWKEEMPPHLSSGAEILPSMYQRILRRERDAAEAEDRARKLRAADGSSFFTAEREWKRQQAAKAKS